jgi:hypothetical protein
VAKPSQAAGHSLRPDPERHRRACRWIATEFRGAKARGPEARRRLARIPDPILLAARRSIAAELRRVAEGLIERARVPLRDRALLIELSDDASAIRELMIEAEAIGVRVELSE